MLLQSARTKLNVYREIQALALECYKITKSFPSDEKFAMAQQIRRAALSVHLNIAEGCSRKSQIERKRFFEISRGSVIEIDDALDITNQLSDTNIEQLTPLSDAILKTFKLLSGLTSSQRF